MRENLLRNYPLKFPSSGVAGPAEHFPARPVSDTRWQRIYTHELFQYSGV